jgi:farnesyl-diphosphate farnesyltransferase
LSIAYLLARASDTIADHAHADVRRRLQALYALEKALQAADRMGNDVPALEENPAAAYAVRLAASFPVDHVAEAGLLSGMGPVLSAFYRQQAELRVEIQWVLGQILGGQSLDLVRFGEARANAPVALGTTADCEAYTYAVAGCVGEFWTRICAIQLPTSLAVPVEILLEHGKRLGQGLQLVNILRDLPQDLARGCCYLPQEEIESLGITPSDLLRHPVRARALLQPWMEKAREWLAHGERYVQGIRGGRLRFSVSLPRRLGEATLDLLEKHPPLETRSRVRVDRKSVYRCAMEAAAEAWGM